MSEHVYRGVARVAKVNVDENVSISQRYGIKGIPTLILFQNGKEAERMVGAASEKTVAQMIDRHASSAVAA
jgi:thioredoxin 1